ncbi:MAG: hypothetical protein N3A66_00505 [Planctomycetota bacterium]|nr:hypothetical protein [Planctomycetota bacterium]
MHNQPYVWGKYLALFFAMYFALSAHAAENTAGGYHAWQCRDPRSRQALLAAAGGDGRTEEAVGLALAWLAAHQEKAGDWRAPGADSAADLAVTGLALLAFLGAGYAPPPLATAPLAAEESDAGKGEGPGYADVLRRGFSYLLAKQQKSGCFGRHTGNGSYAAAIALMAVADAYGLTRDPVLAEALAKGVDYAAKAQGQYGAWDYNLGTRRYDASITGWWTMALATARLADYPVPGETLARVEAFWDRMVLDNGWALYSGDVISFRMSAVSLTCLQFLGRSPGDPKVKAALAVAQRTSPRLRGEDDFEQKPSASASNLRPVNPYQDFYLWYYQTLGIFQAAVGSELWQRYNASLTASLLASQVRDSEAKRLLGSWEPRADPYGRFWGRVGETALAALMLEVYYRFPLLRESRSGSAVAP